ncbi:MAG: hypothetical protein A2Y45_00415 [Tenericutes bacterium GWC2_34_14]|nr:MAG: hypothetical protein A2Z84_02570 [Tenericutes bacterium GWA2_35_7]OHE29366.1 MAG: hypothetical protein A2Y45_00415 [Tenericutes bacterium GWC2_34_14]OHE34463.1 MAG: hypothetical protein A2012_08035 [Tenericutes bacterium GWE2_34_108]OHE35819.1 MAG: hypothetical protein A2Y46_02740 [Tenericutes bacterium GWF1_35_14]OHE39094.1 MAG: hypothetical protein A2Y44_07190 [Tenericutes bacterium GWF2_35_184]OHE42839.1 MAG: hypothetical protein A2221_09045 [Tenericutes bacterium RIFOXYA2_FULL_36_3
MCKEISMKDWVERFNDGIHASSDVQTQIEAGWYDWFCKDSSLANKTRRMGNIIKQIKPGGKVDLDSSFVWFKNNCPLDAPLYDDFRIADINSDSTLLVIQIDNRANECRYTVFDRLNDFKTQVFGSNSKKEFIQWINKLNRNK